ncbi:CPBP family intramembrane metalloprotease [Pueribacillus theae]|uniref:CPBP family intramembrane metalloprotease n=1 Tax=Pueribacillus theae TaxID=2171751 RepID=A0A2U1JMD3_9BACI|nr:type II CAAX endopeptidase family protein [Pueribacillus theae]PWA06331.1 CPBP family intramembrane metalloprotease [Pueribacillus theae]
MRKQYWWILIIYILMQLSGLAGLPLLYAIGITNKVASVEGFVIWSLLSFAAALIPILILSNRIKEYPFPTSEKSAPLVAIGWIFFGVFLSFFVQAAASAIEVNLLKVDPNSENTTQLVEVAKSFPVFFLVFTIIGPILEEIVFRQVIFGSLYTRFNFLISVLISSFIFGIVHGELEHLLIYTSMGATFAFLYVKTKRLIVPIATHVAMNTFAAVVMLFSDKLEELQKNLQHIFLC